METLNSNPPSSHPLIRLTLQRFTSTTIYNPTLASRASPSPERQHLSTRLRREELPLFPDGLKTLQSQPRLLAKPDSSTRALVIKSSASSAGVLSKSGKPVTRCGWNTLVGTPTASIYSTSRDRNTLTAFAREPVPKPLVSTSRPRRRRNLPRPKKLHRTLTTLERYVSNSVTSLHSSTKL